jgi:hypothetical protein
MVDSQVWMIWPNNALLSVLILCVIAIAFLYAGRRPMHDLIRSLGHAVGGPLRLGARSLVAAADGIRERNKAVLLAHGRAEVGQRIEREFERIGTIVTRDLQGYPALQRKLLDEITRIEEDYKKCGEVPPPPPEWVEAVTAVAKVKSNGNEIVQKILEEINDSIGKMHDKTIAEYRRAYESRHKILEGFLPFWRSVDKTMTQVDKKLSGLQETAGGVDAHMEKYEQINAKTDKAEHALTTSGFTQFAIATIVMLVAMGGAAINFKLIALPMSEMVGGNDYMTQSLKTSEVAALVIILVEASMGLFLMEALRITHLFPPIANLSEKMRHRILYISLTLLVTLAGIEAALALMRDMLIADKQALLHTLAATQQQSTVSDGWVARIPTAGQMLLGFILPFALAFVAIPLESFIHSSRTVLGVGVVALLHALAFVLRVLGNLARHTSRVLITLYDVVVMLPLLIEHFVKGARVGAVTVKSRSASA